LWRLIVHFSKKKNLRLVVHFFATYRSLLNLQHAHTPKKYTKFFFSGVGNFFFGVSKDTPKKMKDQSDKSHLVASVAQRTAARIIAVVHVEKSRISKLLIRISIFFLKKKQDWNGKSRICCEENSENHRGRSALHIRNPQNRGKLPFLEETLLKLRSWMSSWNLFPRRFLRLLDLQRSVRYAVWLSRERGGGGGERGGERRGGGRGGRGIEVKILR